MRTQIFEGNRLRYHISKQLILISHYQDRSLKMTSFSAHLPSILILTLSGMERASQRPHQQLEQETLYREGY